MPISEAQRAARSANLRAANATRIAALRQAAADRVSSAKKRCSACGRLRQLEEFGEDRSQADGHRSADRACTNTRRRELAQAKRDTRDKACTPLPGWLTKCCSAPLLDDPEIGWWRVAHKRWCRERWQPGPSGGVVGRVGA